MSKGIELVENIQVNSIYGSQERPKIIWWQSNSDTWGSQVERERKFLEKLGFWGQLTQTKQ